MSIQFFLAFIGSLLGCSIVLAVVVKNLSEGFAVSGKKPFIYGLVSAILASVTAFLTSYVATSAFKMFWFLGGLFLLFGVIHILLIHNRYFYASKYNSDRVLIGEILFGLSLILFTIVIFSSLQYFIKSKDFLFYPVLMSSFLFFVPLLIFHSFEAAYNIPAAMYSTWTYPVSEPIELPDENPKERILVIGFKIAKKATDNGKTYFRVMAPETWKLGDLFYHFINEHNDRPKETPIEYVSDEYEPYEWWFYKQPKWYQTHRILNHEFSVRENGIRENTVIICERIPNAVAISNTIQ